ncbi:MAG: primosomal protein N' [Planctomycetota bacterium]
MPPRDPPATELLGAASTEQVHVGVALDLPLRRLFTYRVPPELAARAGVGHRVVVPFRGKPRIGFVVERHDAPPLARILDVAEAPDAEPLLTPELLALGRFVARYYGSSLGEALGAMVPRAVRHKGRGRRQVRVRAGPEAPREVEDLADLTPAQRRVLRRLLPEPDGLVLADLLAAASVSRSPVTSLEKRGLVTLEDERVDPDPLGAEAAARPTPDTPPTLTPPQQAAVQSLCDALDAGEAATFLLHGVTGSGKTEVYLRALAHAREQGRQAIVLVPEIALTPQTVRRFRRRFEHVAVLHSGMTESARAHAWQRVRQGEVDVVIGPRSAVFAPLPRLGLVVVDEEQEGSFKQQVTPRYHARDVALVRARDTGAVVVLGSATPSLETWHNAERGRWTTLVLPERVAGRSRPDVRIVDLGDPDERPPGRDHVGRTLFAHLQEALADKGQAILFHNRRGYATSVACPRCGHVLACSHCSVSLTYHRSGHSAICHLCGHGERLPPACPECALPTMDFHGLGTQTIEEELARRLPDARVERMDSDTMTRRGSHESVLERFGRGEIDVLLGTQMIAKGLDFPNVLLVGVVAADTLLALPDFRSAERTFDLLAQVAGRAGRGERGGRVVIQTRRPDHAAIRLAADEDMAAFAERELADRKLFGYPPHRRLLRVLVRARDEARADEHAQLARDALVAGAVNTTQILGPAAPLRAKIQGWHRRHVLVKATDHREIGRLLDVLRSLPRPPKGIEIAWDVDPLSLV